MAAPRNEPQHAGITPERWQQVKRVLAAALETEPRERSSYLDRACASDLSLRSEVESLLSAENEFATRPQLLDSSYWHEALLSGTRLGEYEVQAFLGAGGMGEVYRARDLRLGRNVAIKVLPRFMSGNPDRLRQFEQEARAAGALNHLNILSVHQMAMHESSPYLVSELLEGETLRALLSRGPLPLDTAVDYLLQIGRGLAAAHKKGIVHCDLKPENLFVTQDEIVKILDFGLAKLMYGETIADLRTGDNHSDMVMGTPAYASPEQVRGHSTDQRSDIFSFGAIAYEMLTGSRAFQGQSSSDVISAILNHNPPETLLRGQNMPHALGNLVLRCLEKDPSRRCQSADGILAELESISWTIRSAPRGAGHHTRIRRLQIAPAVAILLVAVVVWLRYAARHYPEKFMLTEAVTEEPMLVPLVSLPGEQHMPAASPDGSRVAFVWQVPDAKKSGIYEIIVGSQGLLRLTSNASDYSPTWSPDDRQIAFLRDSKDRFSIELVPARGGPERKLYEGQRGQVSRGYRQNAGLTFSPDGKWLAFSEMDPATGDDIIKSLSLEDSSVRSITSHVPGFQDRYPVFSPNGSSLAFIRSSGPVYIDELYLVSLASGETRRLTSDHHRIFGPPTFTSDSSEIVFSSTRAGIESLWRISVLGGIPRSVSRSGTGGRYPTISAQGKYLAYQVDDEEQNIWRLKLRDETHASGAPEVLIPSGRTYNLLPQFSPDGRKIAFQSSRSGYGEVWICDADGSNLVQVTKGQSLSGSPRWSPDGRYLAFDSRPGQHSEIDVVEPPHGEPHPVARFRDAENILPSWSRDGKWIYFSSNRGGKLFHVWKVSVKDGVALSSPPIQVSSNVGFAAVEALDGRSVFYVNQPIEGIRSVPRDGGEETVVWNGPGPDLWSNWVLAKDGIYFLAPDQPGSEIEFLNVATHGISRIAKLNKPAFYGLSLSPDGRSIIYPEQDRNEHQILLMKNFR